MRHTTESAGQTAYRISGAEFGHPGYDPMFQAAFNEAIQEFQRSESKPPITAQKAVEQLTGIRGYDLDLASVLRRFNPHHVHWKEYPGKYNPGKDLYKWLKTTGLPYFLAAKLKGHGTPKETSHWLYEKYFGAQGIHGDIQVSGQALLDYHTGVRIDSRPQDSQWLHYVVQDYSQRLILG